MKAIIRDNNNDLSENVQGRRDKGGGGGGGTCPYGLSIFGRLVPTKMFVIPTTLKSNSDKCRGAGMVTSPYHFFCKGAIF